VSFAQLVLLLGFSYFFLSLICVGVLDIYGQSLKNGAKRMQYEGVTSTDLAI
jgi:hypothetical protein